ncbi:hypothetical protein F5146DRAFT_1004388 [Armillaria mellea]|nr:hypothetical protein F5146DRAFT_1004388 [Armillaria mellea]
MAADTSHSMIMVSESDSPGEIVAITGVWAGFSLFIQDLAQSLPELFHRGMARLPEAVFKAIHHLVHMESQKHMKLGGGPDIDEGQFSMDYDVTFKPTGQTNTGALQSQESSRSHMSLPCLPEGATLSAEQKELWQDLLATCSWTRCGHLSYWQKVLHLIEGVAWQLRWMHCTQGNPEAYGNKLRMFVIEMGMSELWQQVQGSMSMVAAQNKDAIVTLIQCVTVSPLILFKWNKDAAPIPVFDNQEKPVILKNVEKGLWSLLLGVAGGTFEPEEGLGAAHTMQISPWFDVAAQLKPPRGSKTASIQVAPDAITYVESMVSLPSTSNNNEDASAVEDKHAVAGGLEEAEDIQITVADNKMVGAVTPVKTKADADADESPSEEERVPKKHKKKTKKKSQDLTSEDDDVEESRAVSSAHAFKHHKPPPFRLSKSELKVYADNGADDENYAWCQDFLQASCTKGPVMDAVQCPLHIKSVLEEQWVEVRTNCLKASIGGGTHRMAERTEGFRYAYPSVCSNWSTKPTMEITSSLRMVLEEGLKENKGRILNALTLPMPDTTLQSPLFLPHNTDDLQSGSIPLDACKGTQSIGSDLLGAPFPATALLWGLGFEYFGGSAIKIDILTGCKVWFVISKRQEDKRGETWDMFVHDFQADSKVNSEVYKLMGWVHTVFLSWAITNVEHKDMRILLLHMMAHWKKVITAGEPLEEHDSHVPDLHTWEGLLDVCALGNLLIYLPALSKCQDEYWDNLHFAFMQYWELVSWGNERLTLTGMDGSNDVYELYMAIKLSALQFGLALLDYHTSVADSSLYEALDSGDRHLAKSYDRNSKRRDSQPEDNLFWDIPFSISTVESYNELPPIKEETDSSASSPLTDLLESEPLQSPPLAPAITPVNALAKRPETIIVANLASSQSEDAASAVEEDVWHPTTKRSRSIEWSEHEHSDILSINDWNASEQEAQDEEQNADYEDEDVGDDSDDEKHQADDDADINGSDGAFLDNLKSTSQAMWQANDKEGDDSIEDVADSLPIPAQDGWQVQEEWKSLSPGTKFDLALAMIEVNEATDREIEETPPDAVMTSEGAPQTTGWLRCPSGPEGEFDGGRLEDDFNHFLNPDAFAQGETDEGVLRDIEREPLAHIHSLDMPEEISHLAKESSKVLHLSQTADLMALISATSHSLMTSLPMPQALIDNLF